MSITLNKQTSDLVERDRIHRSVYVDPDLFELEMERLWETAWVFVGHESQIKNAGDYYATQIGRIPVILIRDEQGKIQVINNRCAHKGVKVLPEGCGAVKKRLRCPYHGWTYRFDGSLANVPSPQHYKGTGFDKADARFHMAPVPDVASYRGFVFARFSRTGPTLETFLGDAAATLDNMTDRSPVGKLEVVGRPLRYLHDCNWKMWLENLNDAMHPMVAHASVINAVQSVNRRAGEGSPASGPGEILAPAGASYQTFDAFGITVLPNGHSYMGGKQSVHSGYTDIPDYEEAMLENWGPEKTRNILSQNRHNTIIYPSFTAKDAVQAIRVIKPLAVNRTLIETWHLRLVGAPDELLSRTLLYSRLVNSSGSMVGPDDWECYTRMQEGLTSGPNDWVDIRRGITDRDEETVTSFGTSDLVFRNQYRAWKSYMTGEGNN